MTGTHNSLPLETYPFQLLLQVVPCLHIYIYGGTQWRSKFRHCAKIQNVAGLIPDGVIEIFNRHNPSGRTMALGLTQTLTEMSTRNISWG
jgi:hypothetical protein